MKFTSTRSITNVERLLKLSVIAVMTTVSESMTLLRASTSAEAIHKEERARINRNTMALIQY